jgi:GTP diphosphokinase / guanosine-3',5'-bis(diphosphate) 3'-diphosphatase
MEVISKHEYEAIDKKVEEIIIIVSDYMKFLDYDFVRFEILKAYDYAKNAHHPDRRLSGEPYIIHPVESVEFLLSLKPDLYTIQACFLHDVIEDTTKTFDDILKIFGQDVASLCL